MRITLQIGNRSRILICFTLLLLISNVNAQTKDPTKGDNTGLDIPRFVSAKSNKINVRRGPSSTYKIDWVYRMVGIPLKVIAEYENWRQVVDYEGQGGWVHSRLLSGNRFVIFISESTLLKRKPNIKSPDIAIVEKGVIAELLSVSGRWCQVSIDGYSGWAQRKNVWGLLAEEQLKN